MRWHGNVEQHRDQVTAQQADDDTDEAADETQRNANAKGHGDSLRAARFTAGHKSGLFDMQDVLGLR